MKKIASLLLLGTALSLTAQEGTSWATVQVGEAFRSTDYIYEDGFAYGISAGHWFNDRWGLDLKALRSSMDPRYSYLESREYMGLGSVLFNFRPGAENWYPYLAAGLGGSRPSPRRNPDDELRMNYHLGVGLFGHLTERWVLQFDLKAVDVKLPVDHHTTGLALLGLGYSWGGGKKVLPPPPPPPPPPPHEPKVEAPPPPPPPPPPAPEPPKPAPVVPPPPPAKIVLDEAMLHFANGKKDISMEGVHAIRKVAESLKAFRGAYTLVVSGHTSSVGKASFNKKLSKFRADAVAKVLVDAGIPQASIKTEGMGPDQPLADNKTKEGRAKNRRVEIDVKASAADVETRMIETPTN